MMKGFVYSTVEINQLQTAGLFRNIGPHQYNVDTESLVK